MQAKNKKNFFDGRGDGESVSRFFTVKGKTRAGARKAIVGLIVTPEKGALTIKGVQDERHCFLCWGGGVSS